MGREVVFGFLEKLAEDFQNRVGESAKHALAHSMDSQYGRRLKELMEHYTSHPEEASKVSKVQKQVSEVKGVMMDNIEKVLDRGEKIDLLVDKTSNLRSQVLHAPTAAHSVLLALHATKAGSSPFAFLSMCLYTGGYLPAIRATDAAAHVVAES